MTIVKAIALAALTGTLAFAPQAAFADSQKGGQSGEHGNSAAAKADKATKSDARAAAKTDRAAAKAADQDTDDADDEDSASTTKLRAGPIISAIKSGKVTSDTTSLSGSVTEVDLSELPGNSEAGVIKALQGAGLSDAQTTISNASTNPDVQAALENVDEENAQYAYVDANGTLVVVVP